MAGESGGTTVDMPCNEARRNSPQPVKTGGTPCEVKVSCTVWAGGKSGDCIKGLPIGISDAIYNNDWITYMEEGKASVVTMYDFEEEARLALSTAIAMKEKQPFERCNIVPYMSLDKESAARVKQLMQDAIRKANQ